MTQPTRIYSIRNADGLAGLVEATNAPQALHRWAHGRYSVALATVDDGIEAATSNIEIQRAEKASEAA